MSVTSKLPMVAERADMLRDIHASGNTHELVLRLVERTAIRVLDCAAGGGQVTRRLTERGHQVVPADIAVHTDTALPGLVECDFNRGLPFEDGSFDAVASVETIEHLENPWFFMREIARVLVPGGIAVVTTPNTSSIFSRVFHAASGRPLWFRDDDLRRLGHITPIYRPLLEEMARRAGLRRDAVVYSVARVPVINITFPGGNALLGETMAFRFRKDR